MSNKEKFTYKVDNYLKYRPTYPKELIAYLFTDLGFSSNSILADIGAGTGILTRLLAEKGMTLYAVEPNKNMREACKESCKNFKNVITIDGSAEDTTLPDNSIDYITVAQAFHWFDKINCLKEFKRILKSENNIVLIWNRKDIEDSFVQENSELCKKYCPDYKGVAGNSEISPKNYKDLFKNKICKYKVFDNDLILTLESFIGGTLSASYAPLDNDTNYQNFINELTKLFNKYSNKGKLLLKNKIHSYAGQV